MQDTRKWSNSQNHELMRKYADYIKFSLETCAANVKLYVVYCRAETLNGLGLSAQILRDLVWHNIFQALV